MSNNGAQQSYANDRASSTGDADVGIDPASGSFFSADYKRHEDLKTMLDSNKDGLKLEAMKRIIGMIAKGKDASDLFPAVVKNVVSKNIEVKKLVYVYLVRYAEEQQDLALLSISTFQRGLKDPNQLIRASALRVLSSIRVPVITPIMMLAIKESVTDMSPFVRKTAAHAIPKLHSLDPEQKEFCVEIIEKLLSDKTTLVIGSAVMAFEEVCPEKIDLIHKNYRKLCNLLVDVEEWGQLVIINMLTRYARTQFLNPNKYGEHMQQSEKFYDSSEDDSGGDNNSTPATTPEAPRAFTMDADHRLLLRNAKPLLQSRNAAVVMGVAQLYHHVAPKTEVGLVAKPLVRLLRSHREIQSVVLSNIATMTTTRKSMFEPYLKSFFVRPMDPTHIKLLKLEILTNLATEASIGIILREFHTYVASSDKDFVAATIQAIGRCASTISECTETCMNGLVSLMSNRDEAVVAESVVVVKKLLQMEPSKHKDIIVHMAKLVDKIAVPMARASILWLIGEYAERVPKIAPDVLRKVARSFVNENDIVKLQTLNLATKLFLTNSKQVALLCTYVFNLAKYDQNYDIRDRARLLRQLALPSEKAGVLNKHAKKIFLSAKPAPVLESMFKERDQFQLGTLSHFNNAKASGYQELPDWPATAADPSVRNVEVPMPWSDPTVKSKKTTKKKQSFYSDSEHSSEDSSSGSDSESDTSEESGSEEEEEEEDAEAEEVGSSKSGKDGEEVEEEEEESSESDESSSEAEDSSSEEEESEEEPVVVVKPKKRPPKHAKAPKKEAVDLLLDLDDVPSVAVSPFLKPGETLTPSLLSSGSTSEKTSTMQLTVTAPAHVPTRTHELLNRMAGAGLSVSYRFTRGENIYSASMVTVELTLTNHSDNDIKKISLGQKKSSPGMELKSFPEIECLAVGESRSATIGIDYADTTQPAVLEVVVAATGSHAVSLPAPVGEQLQPIIITDNDFRQQQAKLKGMNENTGSAALPPAAAAAAAAASGREAGGGGSEAWLRQRVYDVANLAPVPAPDLSTLHFAARTRASHAFVLVSVRVADGNAAASVVVHCEKMVVGSMLLKEITKSLCAA